MVLKKKSCKNTDNAVPDFWKMVLIIPNKDETAADGFYGLSMASWALI